MRLHAGELQCPAIVGSSFEPKKSPCYSMTYIVAGFSCANVGQTLDITDRNTNQHTLRAHIYTNILHHIRSPMRPFESVCQL